MYQFVPILVIHSPFATSSWNEILYYLPEHLSVQESCSHDGRTYVVPCLQRSSYISPFFQPQIELSHLTKIIIFCKLVQDTLQSCSSVSIRRRSSSHCSSLDVLPLVVVAIQQFLLLRLQSVDKFSLVSSI